MTDWLTYWLTDWLTDRPNDRLTNRQAEKDRLIQDTESADCQKSKQQTHIRNQQINRRSTSNENFQGKGVEYSVLL